MKKNNVLPKVGSIWLVSGCLVGLKTRYDGECNASPACLQFLADKNWIPVCPEQLGGLTTPRSPATFVGGDGKDVINGVASLITDAGDDVRDAFIEGAQQVFKICKLQDIAGMCVKARSPSCGLHEILGVTSAYLLNKGVMLKEF